jgi:hypothetical protein
MKIATLLMLKGPGISVLGVVKIMGLSGLMGMN